MSLFDVIKYSISDIPTEEELSALPESLLREWYNKFNNPNTNIDPAGYAKLLVILRKDVVEKEVAELRKMIAEYDN